MVSWGFVGSKVIGVSIAKWGKHLLLKFKTYLQCFVNMTSEPHDMHLKTYCEQFHLWHMHIYLSVLLCHYLFLHWACNCLTILDLYRETSVTWLVNSMKLDWLMCSWLSCVVKILLILPCCVPTYTCCSFCLWIMIKLFCLHLF